MFTKTSIQNSPPSSLNVALSRKLVVELNEYHEESLSGGKIPSMHRVSSVTLKRGVVAPSQTKVIILMFSSPGELERIK
jgi:hypothetical protein